MNPDDTRSCPTILVVDDEPDLLCTVQAMLPQPGFAAIEAESAGNAPRWLVPR